MGLQGQTNEHTNDETDEELNMAMAISMSLQECSGTDPHSQSLHNDDMLQRAIEASRLTAALSLSPNLLPKPAQQDKDLFP